MSSIPVLADRVMKARRESVCPSCGGPILIGQRIARCPGRLWFHLACMIGHQHHASGLCITHPQQEHQ